jgi:hypothetical protein
VATVDRACSCSNADAAILERLVASECVARLFDDEPVGAVAIGAVALEHRVDRPEPWSDLLIDTPMPLASNIIRSTCAPARLQQVDAKAEAADTATGDADVVVAAVWPAGK